MEGISIKGWENNVSLNIDSKTEFVYVSNNDVNELLYNDLNIYNNYEGKN